MDTYINKIDLHDKTSLITEGALRKFLLTEAVFDLNSGRANY